MTSMRHYQSLRRNVSAKFLSALDSFLYPGDAGTSERYFSVARIAASIFVFPLVSLLHTGQREAMYAVLAIAIAYSLILMRIVIPRYPGVIALGYVTVAGDQFLLAAALAVTGGQDSPFFVVYYGFCVIYALRFGANIALFYPIIGCVYYIAAIMFTGVRITEIDIGVTAIRFGWVAITSLFATFIMNRTRAAEAALTQELRRTRALLQAAHAPTASLTVAGVSSAVLEQGRILAEAEVAALNLYGKIGSGGMYDDRIDSSEGAIAFRKLMQSNFRARKYLVERGRPVTPTELASEVSIRTPALFEFSSISCVAIPGRQGTLGFLAVARRGEPLAATEHEALAAFLTRASLAIQNARLYEQVQEQLQELRATQDQLVQSARLAALGELAAKVAHELNNPLASVQMYTSLLVESPVDGEEQQRLARAMEEQIQRAQRVVRDILDFSRPRPPQMERLSFNSVLEYGLRLVGHAAQMGRVTVVEDYGGNMPPVMVDRNLIAQVIINLATNAIAAMPNGGTLTVTTGQQSGEIYVRFTDTGTGIEPQVIERIFDPFFTTKSNSGGTGLGLSVCRGIISQHHGRLTVESEIGKGTSFTVWLPPATSKVEEEIGARRRDR